MTLGERLRLLRMSHGLTQNDLARLAGVTRPLISRLERNQRAGINLKTARLLAQAMNISIDELVGDSQIVD